jgi:hypothetical protein
MEQAGQGEVGGAHLVAYALVRPGRLRPVTVEVAGADHHRAWVAAVGEPAAETRVDADMYEHSARAQHPGGLAQHRRVGGHIGVYHHRDDRRNAAVPDRQSRGVGQRDRQAAPGVPQHRARKVDAGRDPAQLADLGRVDDGAAADLQADAAALAQKAAQGRPMPRGSAPGAAVLTRNSCSYQSAISSYAAIGAIGPLPCLSSHHPQPSSTLSQRSHPHLPLIGRAGGPITARSSDQPESRRRTLGLGRRR